MKTNITLIILAVMTVCFFTACKKEIDPEPLIVNGKSITADSVVFSLDGGKTYTKASYANGIYYAPTPVGLFYSEDKGTTWTKSNINIKVEKVYYGKNIWVVATKEGVYYSTDGKMWNKTSVNVSTYQILFFKTQIIALTKSGALYSPDGINYSAANITDSVQSVIITNDILLFATQKGIFTSTDGSTYSSTNIVLNTIALYQKGKLFIAKADSTYFSTSGNDWKKIINFGTVKFANTTDSLYYSNDGVNWGKTNIGKVEGIIYKNNFYEVSVNGKKYYSSDGTDWGSGIFLESGGKLFSRDGKKWYNTDLTLNGTTYDNITFNNGVYHVWSYSNSDTSGYHRGAQKADIYYSLNGINWNKINIVYQNIYFSGIEKVLFFKNIWLYNVGDIIYYSNDGINWSNDVNINYGILNDVDFKNTIYSIKGEYIYASANGLNWNKELNDPFPKAPAYLQTTVDLVTKGNNYWLLRSRIFYNNGIFLNLNNSGWKKIYDYLDIRAIDIRQANGKTFILIGKADSTNNNFLKTIMYVTSDGMNFNQVNLNTYFTGTIIYVNGIYYATTVRNHTYCCCSGCKDNIYYSLDGLNWYPTNLITSYVYSKFDGHIVYNKGLWVYTSVSGGNFAIGYSLDGINWSKANYPQNVTFSTPPGNIAYSSNTFIVSSTAGLLYSKDGKNWITTNIYSLGYFVYYFDE